MSKIAKPEPEDEGHLIDESAAAEVELQLRDNRALETFWESGGDYDAVRKALDLPSIPAAKRRVSVALERFRERDDQRVEAVMARHAHMLSRMENLLMREIEGGSLGFIPVAVKVIEREAKMFGYDAERAGDNITTIKVDIRLPHEREEIIDGQAVEIVETDITGEIEGPRA